MGLDILVLFLLLYSGLVLTGMWFFMGPPKKEETARIYKFESKVSKVMDSVRDA